MLRHGHNTTEPDGRASSARESFGGEAGVIEVLYSPEPLYFSGPTSSSKAHSDSVLFLISF